MVEGNPLTGRAMLREGHEELKLLENLFRRYGFMLDKREEHVLSSYYGFGVPHTESMRVIGERLGVRTERVRQIRFVAIRKLKDYAQETLTTVGGQSVPGERRLLNNKVRAQRANIRRAEEELDGLYLRLAQLDWMEDRGHKGGG